VTTRKEKANEILLHAGERAKKHYEDLLDAGELETANDWYYYAGFNYDFQSKVFDNYLDWLDDPSRTSTERMFGARFLTNYFVDLHDFWITLGNKWTGAQQFSFLYFMRYGNTRGEWFDDPNHVTEGRYIKKVKIAFSKDELVKWPAPSVSFVNDALESVSRDAEILSR